VTAADKWRGPEVAAKLRGLADKAVLEAGKHLLAASNELVPDLASGPHADDLKQSGKTSTERTSGGAVCAVSYNTDYAVLQHELLYYHHKPGQQAKFLETPMSSEVPALRAIVKREMTF